MKVKKETLLIIAGIVWGIAGINILRIGITSFVQTFQQNKWYVLLLMLLLSAVILTGFIMMFRKVVKRHTNRILSYTERRSVFAVFDLKGYLLMAFMMGLGIGLRMSNLLPTEFFAVFYTGLGTALSLGGALFIKNRYSAERTENETA